MDRTPARLHSDAASLALRVSDLETLHWMGVVL